MNSSSSTLLRTFMDSSSLSSQGTGIEQPSADAKSTPSEEKVTYATLLTNFQALKNQKMQTVIEVSKVVEAAMRLLYDLTLYRMKMYHVRSVMKFASLYLFNEICAFIQKQLLHYTLLQDAEAASSPQRDLYHAWYQHKRWCLAFYQFEHLPASYRSIADVRDVLTHSVQGLNALVETFRDLPDGKEKNTLIAEHAAIAVTVRQVEILHRLSFVIEELLYLYQQPAIPLDALVRVRNIQDVLLSVQPFMDTCPKECELYLHYAELHGDFHRYDENAIQKNRTTFYNHPNKKSLYDPKKVRATVSAEGFVELVIAEDKRDTITNVVVIDVDETTIHYKKSEKAGCLVWVNEELVPTLVAHADHTLFVFGTSRLLTECEFVAGHYLNAHRVALEINRQAKRTLISSIFYCSLGVEVDPTLKRDETWYKVHVLDALSLRVFGRAQATDKIVIMDDSPEHIQHCSNAGYLTIPVFEGKNDHVLRLNTHLECHKPTPQGMQCR